MSQWQCISSFCILLLLYFTFMGFTPRNMKNHPSIIRHWSIRIPFHFNIVICVILSYMYMYVYVSSCRIGIIFIDWIVKKKPKNGMDCQIELNMHFMDEWYKAKEKMKVDLTVDDTFFRDYVEWSESPIYAKDGEGVFVTEVHEDDYVSFTANRNDKEAHKRGFYYATVSNMTTCRVFTYILAGKRKVTKYFINFFFQLNKIFLHIVNIIYGVLEWFCQMWTTFSESKRQFETFARLSRLSHFLDTIEAK